MKIIKPVADNALHLVPFIRRHMHADSWASPRFPKTRFQQYAHNEISGSGQDSLHGLARRLLRSAALEVVTDIRI